MTRFANQKRVIWIKHKDRPVHVKRCDLQRGIVGWLVMDSIAHGSARGGIRFGDGVDLEEVKELAAEMTLKFTFLNLSIGGAKAGIRCPSAISSQEKKDILFRFGNCLRDLLRNEVYLPGTDMGTNHEDIEELFRGADLVKNVRGDAMDSGYYTAVSVFSALEAVASTFAIELRGLRIGIQGLGKVGTNVLRLCAEDGVKPVAVSTRMGALHSAKGLDPEAIVSLAEKYGDDFVSHYQGASVIQLEDFFEQDMDILCPCAGLYPIHFGNLDKIRAGIIVSGCNVAAVEEAELRLHERGITYLPGFVCNSGGVLGPLLKQYDFADEEIGGFISRVIHTKVESLLRRAGKEQRSPAQIARSVSQANQERFFRESEARRNGRLRLLAARLRTAGPQEILRTLLWSLCQRGLLRPYFARRWLIRRIVFERLVQS